MHVTQPHSGNMGFGCSQDAGLVLPHVYHMVGCKFRPTVQEHKYVLQFIFTVLPCAAFVMRCICHNDDVTDRRAE